MFNTSSTASVLLSDRQDNYYLSRLQREFKSVAAEVLGGRASRIPEQLDLACNVLYRGVTTGTGRRTLGEQYCDMMQVVSRGGGRGGVEKPSAVRRAVFVATQTVVPYLAQKMVTEGLPVPEDLPEYPSPHQDGDGPAGAQGMDAAAFEVPDEQPTPRHRPRNAPPPPLRVRLWRRVQRVWRAVVVRLYRPWLHPWLVRPLYRWVLAPGYNRVLLPTVERVFPLLPVINKFVLLAFLKYGVYRSLSHMLWGIRYVDLVRRPPPTMSYRLFIWVLSFQCGVYAAQAASWALDTLGSWWWAEPPANPRRRRRPDATFQPPPTQEQKGASGRPATPQRTSPPPTPTASATPTPSPDPDDPLVSPHPRFLPLSRSSSLVRPPQDSLHHSNPLTRSATARRATSRDGGGAVGEGLGHVDGAEGKMAGVSHTHGDRDGDTRRDGDGGEWSVVDPDDGNTIATEIRHPVGRPRISESSCGMNPDEADLSGQDEKGDADGADEPTASSSDVAAPNDPQDSSIQGGVAVGEQAGVRLPPAVVPAEDEFSSGLSSDDQASDGYPASDDEDDHSLSETSDGEWYQRHVPPASRKRALSGDQLCLNDGTPLWRFLEDADERKHTESKTKSPTRQRRGDCPLCVSRLRHPTVTPCGHMFCWKCICTGLRAKPECPMCRSPCMPAGLVRVVRL